MGIRVWDVTLVVECLSSVYRAWDQHCINQAWWCVSVISALRTQRQENHKFNVIFGYLVSSRRVWDLWANISKEKVRKHILLTVYNAAKWMLFIQFCLWAQGRLERPMLCPNSHVGQLVPEWVHAAMQAISQAFLSAAMTSTCLWALTPVYRQNPIPDPCCLAPSSEHHFWC